MMDKIVAMVLAAGMILSPAVEPKSDASIREDLGETGRATVLKTKADVDTVKQKSVWKKYELVLGPLNKRFVKGETRSFRRTDSSSGDFGYIYPHIEWANHDNSNDLRINVKMQPHIAGGTPTTTEDIRFMSENTEFVRSLVGIVTSYWWCYNPRSETNGGIRTISWDEVKITGEPYRPESKGQFIEEVTAQSGTLPNDGSHTDGFWYVLQGDLVE